MRILQWFRRDPQGNGEGIAGYHLPGKLTRRELGAKDFPPALIAEAWSQLLAVARLHRLYPEILDTDGLRVTLVRARLETANDFVT